MSDEVSPTAAGLLRCLQALVEETAALGLTRTTLALQDAVAACRREAGLPVRLMSELDTHLLH